MWEILTLLPDWQSECLSIFFACYSKKSRFPQDFCDTNTKDRSHFLSLGVIFRWESRICRRSWEPPRSLLRNYLSSWGKFLVLMRQYCWTRRYLHHLKLALFFYQEPRVTVGHLIDPFFDWLHAVFTANTIKTLFAIDGARNPLKAFTNEKRKKRARTQPRRC